MRERQRSPDPFSRGAIGAVRSSLAEVCDLLRRRGSQLATESTIERRNLQGLLGHARLTMVQAHSANPPADNRPAPREAEDATVPGGGWSKSAVSCQPRSDVRTLSSTGRTRSDQAHGRMTRPFRASARRNGRFVGSLDSPSGPLFFANWSGKSSDFSHSVNPEDLSLAPRGNE